MQALVGALQKGGYVYETRTNQLSDQVEDFFFVNPISYKIWRAFPHVLILDATYKTNAYGLPLLEIVGLTSTNKTFCVAFAFLQNEREDNFTWVLDCLRRTLDGYMLPRVIVTDRELALMNACENVFLNTTRVLCRWHIMENIKKHCRPLFSSLTEWEKFIYWWRVLIQFSTIDEYKENQARLRARLMNRYQSKLFYILRYLIKSN